MLDEHIIRDFGKNTYTKNEFLEILKSYVAEEYNVYVGTDSQVIKNKISIVTAICFYKDGQSGKVFYMKEEMSKKKHPSLRSRMLLEAYRSVEAAMEIDPYVSSNLEIHLDIGDTIRSKTSAYESELQALVLSQGYSCEIKPNSWASSSVADRFVR